MLYTACEDGTQCVRENGWTGLKTCSTRNRRYTIAAGTTDADGQQFATRTDHDRSCCEVWETVHPRPPYYSSGDSRVALGRSFPGTDPGRLSSARTRGLLGSICLCRGTGGK